MALVALNEIHALQIQAGVLGRNSGHLFEDQIAQCINSISYPLRFDQFLNSHVSKGDPAHVLLHYIASTYGHLEIESAVAVSTGSLATSEEGRKWLEINGVGIRRCKSDLIITLHFPQALEAVTIGISTKQCNNKTPTNAQLYFTTARGFAALLCANEIPVSANAILALRKFCGDKGFQPADDPANVNRKTDPRRYFWEEIGAEGQKEWETLFSNFQSKIMSLLLRKAYIEDHFPPSFLLHKTKSSSSWSNTELAVYEIEELIAHSLAYSSFVVKPYSVRKGSYKDPKGVIHLAPRFGVVQMQRGGQAQHPEQLQFNLEASYFYKIGQLRPNMLSDSESE